MSRDPMELVGRLEEDATGAMACGGACITTTALLTEAAACIREMVEATQGPHPTNEIALAIHDVSMRRLERASRPGKWRVYLDDDNVVFENMERNEPPVVVTTVVKEVE